MDFQTVYNRKNTNSIKWDAIKTVFQTEEDIIPMWVADMDFRSPKEVHEAIIERAKHGIYGYTTIDQSVIHSVTNWLERRHTWKIDPNWLIFSPSVITSLYQSVTSFTNENDAILIQTPVYPPFFQVVKGTNRKLLESPLRFNGTQYEMDYADLEAKFKQGVKAMILCSPHNPVGRVWRREELERLVDLCEKYDVLIFSDEIHGDLVYAGHKHIPIASISEAAAQRTITYMSPTKTFNLAGLHVSYIVVQNADLRRKLSHVLALQGFRMLNMMGIVALKASYEHGEAWLENLLEVLTNHKKYVKERLESGTNGKLFVIDAEGTYLVWVNFAQLHFSDKALQRFLIEQAKVGLNAGIDYGAPGSQHMRINIACPETTLQVGIERIVRAVNTVES